MAPLLSFWVFLVTEVLWTFDSIFLCGLPRMASNFSALSCETIWIKICTNEEFIWSLASHFVVVLLLCHICLCCYCVLELCHWPVCHHTIYVSFFLVLGPNSHIYHSFHTSLSAHLKYQVCCLQCIIIGHHKVVGYLSLRSDWD